MNNSPLTIKEVQSRMTWTLNQKIDHAVGTIESFIAKTGRVPYVSFSGGKDSTVLLDICRRFVNQDMKAVFVNTGNEYPEIVKFVRTFNNVTIVTPRKSIREVIAEYGFPLVSKETAQGIRNAKTTKSPKLLNIRLNGSKGHDGHVRGKIPDKWQFLIQEPFMVSEMCCQVLKKRPLRRYERETGEVPIIGVMAQESRLRLQQYIRRGGCNSFSENHIASYPLSIWTEADIWAYIEKFKVPICSLYKRIGCNRTGCMFCGFGLHLEKSSRLALLYDLHPEIYRAILNYSNNNITYRQALRAVHIALPDEVRQLQLDF